MDNLTILGFVSVIFSFICLIIWVIIDFKNNQ